MTIYASHTLGGAHSGDLSLVRQASLAASRLVSPADKDLWGSVGLLTTLLLRNVHHVTFICTFGICR